MLGGLMPKKKKIRKVSVIEARKILKAEETSKLIDMDKAVSEAIYKAEEDGILFIDEIDKVAGRSQSGSPDVSREGVQRDILPIVEGCTVNTKYGPVKTDHMLFIAAGAFHVSKVTDLIPELQGRFPVQVNLKPLTEEDFRKILTQPENALIKQYQALLGVDDVKLEFTEDALREMAHIAVEMNDSRENIGARRLPSSRSCWTRSPSPPGKTAPRPSRSTARTCASTSAPPCSSSTWPSTSFKRESPLREAQKDDIFSVPRRFLAERRESRLPGQRSGAGGDSDLLKIQSRSEVKERQIGS